jgi:hypothetical protein
MSDANDQAEQPTTEPSAFAAWQADLRRLTAEGGRVVSELASRLSYPPELTPDTVDGLLKLREAIGVPAYSLDRDEWFGDPVAKWFPELAALSAVRTAADGLLTQLDRALGLLAKQTPRHPSLILADDFGGGVGVIDAPGGGRPFAAAPVNRLPPDHFGRALLPASELYGGYQLILGPARAVGVASSVRNAYSGTPVHQLPPWVPKVWAPHAWYGASRAAELTRELEAKRRAEEEDRRRTNEILQEQAEARQRAEQEADPQYQIRRLQQEVAALKAARE